MDNIYAQAGIRRNLTVRQSGDSVRLFSASCIPQNEEVKIKFEINNVQWQVLSVILIL